jgi:hypothetical protein
MIKKLFRYFAFPLAVIGVLGVSSFANAQLTNTKNPFVDKTDGGSSDQVTIIGTGKGQNDAFINVVKGAVNRVLGILALIALLVLLWGGFQMVTAAGDSKKYEAGFEILKQAATGLILIGIARFIISIIFWLVVVIGQPADGSTANTDT